MRHNRSSNRWLVTSKNQRSKVVQRKCSYSSICLIQRLWILVSFIDFNHFSDSIHFQFSYFFIFNVSNFHLLNLPQSFGAMAAPPPGDGPGDAVSGGYPPPPRPTARSVGEIYPSGELLSANSENHPRVIMRFSVTHRGEDPVNTTVPDRQRESGVFVPTSFTHNEWREALLAGQASMREIYVQRASRAEAERQLALARGDTADPIIVDDGDGLTVAGKGASPKATISQSNFTSKPRPETKSSPTSK